ncbi:MAG: DUF58 domain-containing protein [Planctomycetes bacterium]|nr:DUF58 domain-containing protein [Planctomycetota bacterium]
MAAEERKGLPRQARTFFDEDFLARLQRLHLVAKQLAARSQAGVRRSHALGDGLEFADHRDYSFGDDLRFIDWPYYARMEKLLLRLFHEHSESDVAVLLDCSGSMAPGGATEKFDYARRLAAALAYVAMGSLERVILQPFADSPAQAFRSSRNRADVLQVIACLSEMAAGGGTSMRSAVDRFMGAHRNVGIAFIISDLMDCGDELSDSLAALKSVGCDAAVLHVYGPAEARPDIRGPMLLVQAETREKLTVLADEAMVRNYCLRWDAFQDACRRACTGRGCTYIAVPTDMPFERLILYTLRQAGVIAG